MNPIRCLIIDDEPLAIKVIENYVQQMDDLELVASLRAAIKAFPILEKEKIDLIFLDIQMPQLSGIDFAKHLPTPPPLIIFTTAYRDFAVESYELNAVDYLVKPIAFERFFQAIRKVKTTLTTLPTQTGTEETHILVKADKKQFRIKLKDIRYIESIKDYIILHTPNQKLISYQSISHIQEALPHKQFLRIHRSYIIALDYLTAFNATYVFLGDDELPIGRTYKEEVLQKLEA